MVRLIFDQSSSKSKTWISSEIMEITLYRAFWGCSDIFSQIIWKATHTGSSILAFPRRSATFNEFPSNYASFLIIRNRYNPFKGRRKCLGAKNVWWKSLKNTDRSKRFKPMTSPRISVSHTVSMFSKKHSIEKT